MDVKAILGNRIKDLRKAKKISQNDLANSSKLDRSYIANVECGKRNISIVNIEKIAAALHVSLMEFFDDGGFGDMKEI